MILIDTNVISELMRPVPEPAVLAWIDGERRSDLFTSVIVRAEIHYGIECLPDGTRRDRLAAQAALIFGDDFAGRVLPVSEAVADHYAAIAAANRREGRARGLFDTLIAATAAAAGFAVATRNTADFEGCGVVLINPWQT